MCPCPLSGFSNGISTKPGTCPSVPILDCDIAFLANGRQLCLSDTECPGLQKCCQTNYCGGMTCKYPNSALFLPGKKRRK